MKKYLLAIFAIYIIIFSTFTDAYAFMSDWKKTEEVSSRIVIGNQKDGQHYAGIQLKLKENWHSYWRNPGDGGMAPTIDWTGSSNIKHVQFLYPAPTRFQKIFEGFDPVETYGYADDVLFPLIIIPEDATKPSELILNLKYAVCDELCIFLNEEYKYTLSAQNRDEEAHTLIQASLSKVALENQPALTIESVDLREDALTLEVTISAKEPFKNPDIFVEVSPDFRFNKPQFFFAEGGLSGVAKISYTLLLEGKNLGGSEAIITLVNDGSLAIEKKVILSAATAVGSLSSPSNAQTHIANVAGSEVPAPRPFSVSSEVENATSDVKRVTNISESAAPPHNLIYILFFAFIGGLILNIMPCVLPVLSLKLVGIAKHGGGNTRHVRSAFIASSAGILASFLVLAVLVISLKSAGHAIGWGFHFQQPLFVIALIIFLNLFAANQWSLFEIQLPYWLGGRIANALPKADNHTLSGHFMTGVAAAVLATPCSAPYLGTAVGFALSQGSQEILLVFMMMGIGLAFPYVLLMLMPQLVTKLPKPGMWMLRVKHIMGYLLAATSIWLIYVLAGQLGLEAALIVAMLSLASLVLLRWHKARRIHPSLLVSIITIGIIVTFMLPMMLGKQVKNMEVMDKTMWQPFNEQTIPKLVQEGYTVFVDVTADWCLTCKFNKLHVLNVGKVHEALMAENVITMKADYTNPSAEITAYLQKHGRYGIPFNIIYGKAAPEGIPLKEYLREQDVLNALQQAQGQ